MADWRSALPLLFITSLIILDDLITAPSCVMTDGGAVTGGSAAIQTNLKAMFIADLLLKGSYASYADTLFRNFFISRFIRKAYEKLEPDMLVVLGDIADKRAELEKSGLQAVLQQLYRLIGSFDGVPLVVGLGERDVGECSELEEEFVAKISSNLPGLDRTGSASFRIENVSFFLINSVPLLCNVNALRFDVEKLIETESFDLRAQLKDSLVDGGLSDGFPSLKHYPPSGSGPILLLHFPLSRAAESSHERNTVFLGEGLQRCERKGTIHVDSDAVVAPSSLMLTLPLNETEYIMQSLKPRMIFSAHMQHFNVYIHRDGAHEVSVPAMTWALRGNPGFVFASFGQTYVRVSHCSFPREAHVLMGYFSILFLLLAAPFISRGSRSINAL